MAQAGAGEVEESVVNRLLIARVFLTIAALPVVGCSTHYTTLVRESDNRQVIYRISEEQAFTIALGAFAEVLPKQSLFDITGNRRGYQSTWRWGLDTYSQKVLIIPAVGTDATGREVRGYWYDLSGEGTSGSGMARNRALYQRIQEALDATGTATVVTNTREGRYDTGGHAYRALGRDASEAASTSQRRKGTGAADQLRELKAMYEQGLITKEEYEAKRRQILDRL